MKLKRAIIKILDRLSEDPASGWGLGSTLEYCKVMENDTYTSTLVRWFTPDWLAAELQSCAELRCKKEGHDMDVESWANGDTGQEHHRCKNCGETWHHIYY